MIDINKLIRQEIPIKSFVVTAFICNKNNKRSKYLIIKRNSKYLNNCWQMISGKIEKGETGWQAILREIKEETGIIPGELYSSNKVELFYENDQNCINLCPIFVAFVNNNALVKLSKEHNDYKWITAKQAKKYLIFDQQIDTIKYIERCFIKNNPNEFLKINFTSSNL